MAYLCSSVNNHVSQSPPPRLIEIYFFSLNYIIFKNLTALTEALESSSVLIIVKKEKV